MNIGIKEYKGMVRSHLGNNALGCRVIIHRNGYVDIYRKGSSIEAMGHVDEYEFLILEHYIDTEEPTMITNKLKWRLSQVTQPIIIHAM